MTTYLYHTVEATILSFPCSKLTFLKRTFYEESFHLNKKQTIKYRYYLVER